MQQDDPRAFRPHLAGANLIHAQEKFLASLMRAPSLWRAAARSNVRSHHFHPSLRPIFELVTMRPNGIRDAVAFGTVPMAARIFRLYAEPGAAQIVVLQLALQIRESGDRAELARIAASKRLREQDKIAPDIIPVTSVLQDLADQAFSLTENSGDTRNAQICTSESVKIDIPVQAVSNPTGSLGDQILGGASDASHGDPRTVAATPPAHSGKETVKEFLRRVLADGPQPVREIERKAVVFGLLAEGQPIGASKPFRTARAKLAIKPRQMPGEKAGGWVWGLSAATRSDAPTVAAR
jgi:hypothetical protein